MQFVGSPLPPEFQRRNSLPGSKKFTRFSLSRVRIPPLSAQRVASTRFSLSPVGAGSADLGHGSTFQTRQSEFPWSNNFSEEKIRKVRSGTLRLLAEFEYRGHRKVVMGAGILYDKEGHILTNAHVVSVSIDLPGVVRRVVVNFEGGEQCDAEVLFVDFGNDVAYLKIPESVIKPSNIPCDFSKAVPRMGDKFFVVGHLRDFVPFNVKYGHVSDPSRSPSDIRKDILKDFPLSLEHMDPAMKFIELDATGTRGFSGGPLSTADGKVFGVFHAGIPGNVCYGIPFAIIESSLGRMFKRSPGDDVFSNLN